MSRLLSFLAVTCCLVLSASRRRAAADSFDMEKNGKLYHCEQKDFGGGDGCWNKCNYDFGTCKGYCGPKQMSPLEFFHFQITRGEKARAEQERLQLSH